MTQNRQQSNDKREETLGQRIFAQRKKRGWSREKLADKLGTVSLTIYRWENDRSFPRGDEIQIALIKVLGLPADEFTKQRERQTKEKEVPLPPEKDVAENEMVEYKIPPIIMYRGLYERTFDDEYGEDLTRRVTTDGKKLLPYETWVNADTVIFGWGHVGVGSSHLAQSILLDYFEHLYPKEDEKVLRSFVEKYFRNFATDFTIWFEREKNWELWSGAITAWLKEERENGDPAPSHSLEDVHRGWVGWSERWDKYRGT